MNVRFSPEFLEEIIEFEVELNSVPIDKDNRGKDVVVNWQFFDGFDPHGTFWTDSNGLQMMERKINYRPQYTFRGNTSYIGSNYYPVDSAIAMRDKNGSNLQVTIMNDRAQGGAADLSS